MFVRIFFYRQNIQCSIWMAQRRKNNILLAIASSFGVSKAKAKEEKIHYAKYVIPNELKNFVCSMPFDRYENILPSVWTNEKKCIHKRKEKKNARRRRGRDGCKHFFYSSLSNNSVPLLTKCGLTCFAYAIYFLWFYFLYFEIGRKLIVYCRIDSSNGYVLTLNRTIVIALKDYNINIGKSTNVIVFTSKQNGKQSLRR